jgi:hypothetical protein
MKLFRTQAQPLQPQPSTKSLKTPAATPFAVVLLPVKATHTVSPTGGGGPPPDDCREMGVLSLWPCLLWRQMVLWRRPVCHLLVEARPLSSGAPSRLESEEMEKEWTRAEEFNQAMTVRVRTAVLVSTLTVLEASDCLSPPIPSGQDDVNAMQQAMLQYLNSQKDSTYGIGSLDIHTAAEKSKGKATVSHETSTQHHTHTHSNQCSRTIVSHRPAGSMHANR